MKTQKKWYFLLGVNVFLTSAVAVPALADDGVPGVLRFAAQYHAEKLSGKGAATEGKSDTSSGKSKPTAPADSSSELTGSSSGPALISTTELKRRLALREREITQLKKENRRLRTQPAASASEEALKEALSNVNTRLKTAQTEHKQALDAFAEQASQVQKSLESRILSLTQKVGTLEATNTTLQAAKQKDIDTLKLADGQYQTLKAENKSLETENVRLKTLQKAMPVVEAEELSTPVTRQTYAAGVMLGRDVLAMQQAQTLLGLTSDSRILLAGLRDALNSQVLLNSDALLGALANAEETAQKARQKIAEQQKKTGKTYLTKFRKGKGVQQDPLGFWYRIEYPGDGEQIKDDESIVDVVVVEKLTDGVVVEDMDARGRVISQPLSDYPALFRAALTQLKNHGSMTLVVPSSLAYGDEGYPPKVPPGATLVYTLRVEQVTVSPQPPDAEKDFSEKKAKPADK